MQSISALNNLLRRGEAQDALSRLVSTHKLTADGREWLTAALDPFHDYEHQIAGYPDTDVSQTVVSCYQYEVAVSAPASAAGANWDCHVFSLPIATSHSNATVATESADWSSLTIGDPPGAPVVLAPINIVTGPAGAALGFTIPNTTTQVPIPAAGVEDVSSGCSRVIAAGFEVHNTTAEISKQGSVTTYRMPQSAEPYMNYLSAGGANWLVMGNRVRGPPTTVAQANLLKGTRTWSAKDGVYATLMQGTVHNPLRQLSTQAVLVERQSDPGVAGIVATTPSINVDAAGKSTPAPTQVTPFDTTGAIFTGLSTQTTLVVKVRLYVERAPTWNDAALAVLASPSAGYDVAALQLYAQVINMLPPAVMVGENAKGDWWRAVVSVIKHVAGPLGLALNPFVPGSALVGGAVSSLAGQIDTRRPVSQQVVAQAQRQRPRSDNLNAGGQGTKAPAQKAKKKSAKAARQRLLLTQ